MSGFHLVPDPTNWGWLSQEDTPYSGYSLAYLAPANRNEDDVGLSSVSVVGPCVPVTPPYTLMAREP